MLIANFQGQIVFINKLLYISKRVVTNKSKKNRFDADGKAMAKTMYAIAFHYDNSEISQIVYSTEKERDDAYNKFLAGDFTSHLKYNF